jgi:hypothetical protein
MKKILTILAITLFIFLIGCKKDGEAIDITSPFIGGTTGLVAEFVEFRSEVFDGGRDPFDVVVKLENKGEAFVSKDNVRVKISGVNPAEFSKLEEDLIKSPEDDLLEMRKEPTGDVIPSPAVFAEFVALNHFTPIAGATATFPVRADLCYQYRTQAVSKLCIRENLLNPEAGGICEITEDKPVFNSGAPIQISNVRETTRARDKIGFSFEISNVGTGDVFEKGSVCDRSTRAKENRVFVTVNTNMPGISCTGLTTVGTRAEGFATLFDGKKIITCSQGVSTRIDFEQLFAIEAVYDYEEFQQTTLTVKSSGETTPPPEGG